MFKNLIQSKNEIVLQNTVRNDSVPTWGEWQGGVANLVLKNHAYNIAAPFICSLVLTNLVKGTWLYILLSSLDLYKVRNPNRIFPVLTRDQVLNVRQLPLKEEFLQF